LPAAEALRLGLVSQVVSPEQLMPAAETLAKKIIANAPLAVRFCMQAVNRGLEGSAYQGQSVEAALFALACATEDMKEGTRAFLEKRQAGFKGK
jgi:enoyl-CoA hydratase